MVPFGVAFLGGSFPCLCYFLGRGLNSVLQILGLGSGVPDWGITGCLWGRGVKKVVLVSVVLGRGVGFAIVGGLVCLWWWGCFCVDLLCLTLLVDESCLVVCWFGVGLVRAWCRRLGICGLGWWRLRNCV